MGDTEFHVFADSSTDSQKNIKLIKWGSVYSAPGVNIECIHAKTVVWMHSILTSNLKNMGTGGTAGWGKFLTIWQTKSQQIIG